MMYPIWEFYSDSFDILPLSAVHDSWRYRLFPFYVGRGPIKTRHKLQKLAAFQEIKEARRIPISAQSTSAQNLYLARLTRFDFSERFVQSNIDVDNRLAQVLLPCLTNLRQMSIKASQLLQCCEHDWFSLFPNNLHKLEHLHLVNIDQIKQPNNIYCQMRRLWVHFCTEGQQVSTLTLHNSLKAVLWIENYQFSYAGPLFPNVQVLHMSGSDRMVHR